MRSKTRKMIITMLVLMLVLSLFYALPITANAATDIALINVSTLGASPADNSAATTESQWNYNETDKILRLTEPGGNYSLNGTNTDLMVLVEPSATGATIILDNLSITASSSRNHNAFVTETNCTVTLVGVNTLTANGRAFWMFTNNTSCTINGDGSLTVTGGNGGGESYGYGGIDVNGSNRSLSLQGTVSVTARSLSNVEGAIVSGNYRNISIGHGTLLTYNNESGATQTIIFTTPNTSGYQWKLTGTATTTYPLTDTSISVSVPSSSDFSKISRTMHSNSVIDIFGLEGGDIPVGTYDNWSFDNSTNTISMTGNVTVIGTKKDAINNAFLSINTAGFVMTWTADYSCYLSGWNLISLSGAGTFEMTEGNIEQTTLGRAIETASQGNTISISGGTVYSVGTSISVEHSNTTINISGGTIESQSLYAVALLAVGNTSLENVSINISGGTVTSNYGHAIENNSKNSSNGTSITISGGSVSSTSTLTSSIRNAINNRGRNALITVSGGSVSSMNGSAISTNQSANIVVSDGTLSTVGAYPTISIDSDLTSVEVSGGVVSATDGHAILSVPMSSNNLNISGGTISATGTNATIDFDSKVTLAGGTVSAVSATAIYANEIEVTGTVAVSNDGVSNPAIAIGSNGLYTDATGDLMVNGYVESTDATSDISVRNGGVIYFTGTVSDNIVIKSDNATFATPFVPSTANGIALRGYFWDEYTDESASPQSYVYLRQGPIGGPSAVVIDVGYFATLGSDDDNSVNAGIEDQWRYEYDGTYNILTLLTAGGHYTLTGTNTALSLRLSADAADTNIVFDNLNIRSNHIAYWGTDHSFRADCTITLVGQNYLAGNRSYAFSLSGVNCTINGSGSLELTDYYGYEIIEMRNGASLSVVENASVNAICSSVRYALYSASGDNSLYIGETAMVSAMTTEMGIGLHVWTGTLTLICDGNAYFGSFAGSGRDGIRVSNNAALLIGGSGTVTIKSGSFLVDQSVGTSIMIDDDITLMLDNSSSRSNSVTLEKFPKSTCEWVVSPNDLTTDPLYASSIEVTLPAGGNGSVSRALGSTSMAVININPMTGTFSSAVGMGLTIGNSVNSATQSQWTYNDATKVLALTTTGGNYTLTGTNAEIRVTTPSGFVIGTDINVVLNNVNISAPSTGSAFYAGDNTITLIGSNYLNSASGNGLIFLAGGTIKGSGELTASGIYFQAGNSLSIEETVTVNAIGSGTSSGITVDSGATIIVGSGATLNVSGSTGFLVNGGAPTTLVNNGMVTATGGFARIINSGGTPATQNLILHGSGVISAIGSAGSNAISGFTKILVGEDVELSMTNNSTVVEINSFEKSDAASTYHWSLTGVSSTGLPADASIDVSLAAGKTGTIRRVNPSQYMVVIDITPGTGTFAGAISSGATVNNSANAAFESQWEYNDATKRLLLTTSGGKYTITGTNADIRVVKSSTTNSNVSIILDNVSITAPSQYTALALENFWDDSSSTLTLVGTNYLNGTSGLGLSLAFGNHLINGNGTLTVSSSSYNSASFEGTAVVTIEETATVNVIGTGTNTGLRLGPSMTTIVDSGATLNATGNSGILLQGSNTTLISDGTVIATGGIAREGTSGTPAAWYLNLGGSGTVTVIGNAGNEAIREFASVQMSDDVTLIMTNDSTSDETHSFTVTTVGSTYVWILTNAATSDPVADSNIDITVSAGQTGTVRRAFSVAPSISSHANFTCGSGIGGNFQVTASGTEPIFYSLAGEPAGVSINSATGLITIDDTTAEGTYNFTVTASNGTLPDAVQVFTLTIDPITNVAPSITGPTTMTLTEGYGATSTGAYTVTGTPAPTVTQTSGNAAITWNDQTQCLDIAAGLAAGTYPVVLTASNGTQPDATITFTLTVNPPAAVPVTSITVIGAGGATAITTLNGSLQMLATVLPANATDNSITWSVVNGPGSAIIDATGLLTATGDGIVAVTATANDGSGVTGAINITISGQQGTAPTITSANNYSCEAGMGGSFNLTATSSTPINWVLGSMAPTGVTISGNVLTVAPNVSVGTHNFTIQANNSAGQDTQTFTLTVTSAPVTTVPPSISGPINLTLTEGYAATSTSMYTVTGNPAPSVTITSGTAEITWNSTAECIDIDAGIPVGSYTAVLTASNSAGSDTATFTLTVTSVIPTPVPPTIVSADNYTLVEGSGSSFGLSATGTAPIVWSLDGTEPAGVTISGSTLNIAATVPAGTYSFVVTADNNEPPAATQAFTLTVTAAPVIPAIPPTITGPATMTLSTGYAARTTEVFTVTGDPAPVVSKTSGDAAITWNNATYRMEIAAGLPAGRYEVVLTAANGVAPDATITFTLTIQRSGGGGYIGGGGGTGTGTGTGDTGSTDTGSTDTGSTDITDGETPLVETPFEVFNDVKDSDWFYEAAGYVYGKGLMIGVSDDRFDPNGTLTRGMIVTILYRLAGEPSADALANPFSDVADDVWYTDAIKWAAANNIVLGYGNGRFGPSDPVTKEQLAALIYRNQQASGKKLPIIGGPRIPDAYTISAWAIEAVTVLNDQGLFEGIPGADFKPQQPATRAEVADILFRWLSASE